eukprot:NODE_5290_length_674_cov_10.480804_g5127_i0.p1 GENE.NODE_5290_length_674_cov_10.480804_g5127_i0~~NODE_5290_length_674_cov_10.480804_g5127_i0.p1  ORF type:complete len:215 (-),score=75.44 NODE_5290_length_674_cov_10.480804_g5127_i0:30-644(-)
MDQVPYDPSQRILLIGEGNFSFAAALARVLGDASNVLCTSFDSVPTLAAKYGDVCAHVHTCLTHNASILCGVDATQLAAHPSLAGTTYDVIVFNFPHTGLQQHGVTAKQVQQSVVSNRLLLLMFFCQAQKLLSPHGQVHVTMKRGTPYTDWQVEQQAQYAGLHLRGQHPFPAHLYPGYHHKATRGSGVSGGQIVSAVQYFFSPS